MLGDVETGYEGKFDFPLRSGAPSPAYLLASVPRTGSTYLSHLLWRTGCLGAPLEYLNFEPSGPYGFASGSAELQQQLWRSVVSRRTSPNGVFGIKCFPMQLEALAEANPTLLAAVMSLLLPRQGPRKVVHLGRRDRKAHLVSYARATLSGVWRKEQEQAGAAEPAFDAGALATAERWLAAQESAWEQMFGELGIEPLRLWYEEVVDDPDRAVREVADHLGIVLDPAAAVAVPEIERQAQEGARAWKSRLAGGGA
jgi:LPS sulfotransferase NodH